MESRVLVAYGTKRSATAEIAERIGQVLRDADMSADVRSADEVDDLVPYDAVVLGSAVYMGRWRRDAARLLRRNEEALAERPVWLFSSGPTEEGDPVELTEGWRFPEKLQPIADRIGVREIVVFHGVMKEEDLGPIERGMINKIGAPYGDYRDWEAIAAWARGIAEELNRYDAQD